MSLVGFLALAFVLVLLSFAGLLVLLARFITSDSDEDRAVRFDPFAPVQPSLWFLDFFHWWRRRPRQLTYRRDRRGRFRKL